MRRASFAAPLVLVASLALLIPAARGEPPAPTVAPFLEADVPVFVNDETKMYRLPSLLVTAEGTVLAACKREIGTTDNDFARSCLVLRRSPDGGKTFEPEETLYFREGYVTFNGNLVEDRQTGTIFACFITFPFAQRSTWFDKTWVPRGGGFWIVTSSDDGVTWSEPIEVMPEPNADGWRGGGALNCNHGVQLQHGPHAGRLVIAARTIKRGTYEKRAKGGLIYSDDHGQSWRVGAVVLREFGSCNGEVALAETADGEVYVNSRNTTSKNDALKKIFAEQGELPGGIVPFRRIYSRSRDGGETFYEEGCQEELRDPPCNAGLTQCAMPGHGHLLLHTKPAAEKPGDRTHLTGYVSRDGGRTWIRGRVISAGSGGYSDVAVTADGTILTLYENRTDRAVLKGMLCARFDPSWLLAESSLPR